MCVCHRQTGQLNEMVWDGTKEELEWIGIALASGKVGGCVVVRTEWRGSGVE